MKILNLPKINIKLQRRYNNQRVGIQKSLDLSICIEFIPQG